MSAREVLARGLAAKRHNTPWEELRPFTRACFRTLALTIERILTAAGFSIVHKDEIHAPSVERCMAIVDTDGKISGADRDRISDALRELMKEVGR